MWRRRSTTTLARTLLATTSATTTFSCAPGARWTGRAWESWRGAAAFATTATADGTASTRARAAKGEGEGDHGDGTDGTSPTETQTTAQKMTASARRVHASARDGAGLDGNATRESWGWVYDLTDSGETVDRWVNSANARLSDRVKTQMYLMNKEDPTTWDVAALASKYRVRQQRVGAILALKRNEEKMVEAGEVLYHDLESGVEAAAGAVDIGSGERHISDVPTMPRFQVVSAFERGRDAKPKKFIEATELAKQQEKVLVQEFFERLEYNMGVRGPGLIRANRRTHAPRRPKEGYALHVTPLGDKSAEPYIAYKDGTRRPLNEDEREHRRQKTPKPRRRII